ncbi:MAG: T9SS C-terminal target domain-containing protein [Bacteroidetes bacterium]|nr:MAG: T9SS C-terminal target domain-containing protein [Bacteroidota bacterium]REK05211.1 MAG: T9SS C-terminal target domain-containing protein [Bacteroidota bacterium]REK32616.1 MAG: T9SS C-terminal target domain-containing protein [Bacteroidota bacterium]REK48937.1 MAG: T9SS C-terminal target domain-containing protein [Bacteroidota bacterium]
MNKILTTAFVLATICFNSAFATNEISKSIISLLEQHTEFKKVELLTHIKEHNDEMAKADKAASDAHYFELEKFLAENISSNYPDNIEFIISLNNGKSFTALLKKSSFMSPEFNIRSSSNPDPIQYEKGAHYQGIIHGDSLSLCAVSIFKDEVMGFFSSPGKGNMVLARLDNSAGDVHILYNDLNLKLNPEKDCHTEYDANPYSLDELTPLNRSVVNCINLYWEINYDVYTGQGSMSNTTNFALGLFNQSATLYTNDGIPVQLSQLYIWDIPSPYTATSTLALLNQFKATRTSFSGDLAHLIGHSGGGGVAASTSGICASNRTYSMCYSGVHSSYQNVPLYSWSVEVVTHEQGHLMGSRHTHGCVWNGNNTAIDDCGPRAGYPYEGSCSGAPTPTNGGTIMSYCHLTGTGINFANGFGPQPTAVIMSRYNSGACLTACTGGSFCGAGTDLQSTNITTSSAYLSWNPALNAVSYNIQYRISGSSTWTSDTTSNTFYPVSGLQSGYLYEWQLQTVCSGSNSIFSSSVYFITVPLVCNIPGGMSSSFISSLNATVSWLPVNAAIRYIVRYKSIVSGVWLSDSTSGTSITLRSLTPNTDYEWQVQTVCAGEGVSGYSSSNLFSTLNAGSPVTVLLKPDAACGKDAFIESNSNTGMTTNNFGDNPDMNALAWTVSGNLAIHRILIDFDLSFIPEGSGVQSAYLSLYWNPTHSNPGHSTISGSNAATLKKIIQPWDENNVTFANQPATTSVNSVQFPASLSSTQDYINMDVTSMVQEFVNDPGSSHGWMLTLDNETAYRSLVFASSDNPNPTKWPSLELTYVPNLNPCKQYQYSSCEGVDALIGNAQAAGYDTLNFGDSWEFDALAWTYSGQKSEGRSLIYWDFSEIPSNAIVNSADLTLYWVPVGSNPGHSNQSGPNDASLYRITSPWNEHTVTWNTQPSIDTSMFVHVPASTSPQQDYTLDLTSIVQRMVNDPAGNHGLLFKLNNENYYRSLVFCSSDHPDPARHPRIDVCYTLPTSIDEENNNSDLIFEHYASKGYMLVKSQKIFPAGSDIQLYSIYGKLLMYNQSISGNMAMINLKELQSGIYFVRVNYSGKVASKKFVVAR